MTGGSVRYTEHAPWLHATTSKCNAAYLYENQTNGPTTGYRALGWAEKVLGAEGATMPLESGYPVLAESQLLVAKHDILARPH